MPPCVGSEKPQAPDVGLSFLTPGKRYSAEIYRDGEGANWETAPFAFVRETRVVGSGDRIKLQLGAGGGAAVRFVPVE